MHLESLNIRGFGCLRTRIDFAPDRLNLAVADNEAGKSTLVAAILAAFYGIEEHMGKTSSKRPHKRQVTPWTDPDEFGVELDFYLGTQRWRIERDFASGDVRLIDRDSGRDLADEFHIGKGRYQIGEKLLGLSVESFLKSFYLRQDEQLTLTEPGDLTHHIQQVATSIEGGTTSGQAIERLRGALDRIPDITRNSPSVKVETALKRLQEELDSVRREIATLDHQRASIEPQIARMREIETSLETLRQTQTEALKNGDAAEIRESSLLLEKQDALAAEAARLAVEASELTLFEQFPAARADQLISLEGLIAQKSADAVRAEERLASEGIAPLEKVEKALQDERTLAGVGESDLRELDSAVSRLGDRLERLNDADRELNRLRSSLDERGLDREQFTRLKALFGSLTADEKRFVESFRALYAEVDGKFREQRTRREWVERERSLIITRQKRVAATARTFFLLAAITVLTGGALILLTKGEWLGQVLAGLGVFFGAAGAIARGASGGGADAAALRKLNEDLGEAMTEEEESGSRLEQITRDLTDLAVRLGEPDGTGLMNDYLFYDQMSDAVEPLLTAENAVERASGEASAAADLLRKFFDRAGLTFPERSALKAAAESLLERYRKAVRLSEEFKTAKARRDEIERDIERLKSDLSANRALFEEILRLGSIDPSLPPAEAVATFKSALDKHHRLRTVRTELQPRIEREQLPEVDLAAKRERLSQLRAKFDNVPPVPPHSREFYQEAADNANRHTKSLEEERRSLERAVVTVLDRYEGNYGILKRKAADWEDRIERIETFRSDVETALQVLSDISREVYRNWATALSEEAAPFLVALNPRYSELKFDEHLTFTVLDTATGKRHSSHEVEAVLSTGARDEVFLAARLGIARYLSRSAVGPMPVVLDEPLAAVDDDKFISGMRFFLNSLSRQHQVLVMSCHEERHRWLGEQMGGLFEDRVRRIELKGVEG
ncbi:MAG: hypothetical protein FJY67_00580 [Calditrichaeota bacterium]|nr:hypothetical protein [Calditrichota bacterium]